jgi:antitoxin HicB
MKKQNIGSSFDSFLEEEGIKEEVELRAQKAIIAQRVATGLARSKMTQAQLARAMDTSRTVVHRLLDPTDTSVTLATLARASKALGMRLLHLSDIHADVPASSTGAAGESVPPSSHVSEPSTRKYSKLPSRGRTSSRVAAKKKSTAEGVRRLANRGPGVASAREASTERARKSKHRASRRVSSG